jgi:hypothetical protein
MRKEWEATVSRDGRFWLIRFDGLDGATQARNLREVDVMATEFVAIMTDQEPDDVTVTCRIELPKDVRAHLAAVEASRRAETEARQAAASESRQAARALRALGLSVREVGAVLGMSHQRAQQLVGTESKERMITKASGQGSVVKAPRQASTAAKAMRSGQTGRLPGPGSAVAKSSAVKKGQR